MNLEITQIDSEDAEIVAKLNSEIFRHLIVYDSRYIEEVCKKKQGYVLKVNGWIVGYVICDDCHNLVTQSSVPTIMSIGVLEKYRGHGLGKELVRATYRLYKNCDIYLSVQTKNLKALELYKSEKFVVIATIKNYYNLPGGYEDAYAMVRLKEDLSNRL